MANTSSAKKITRQIVRRTEVNKARRSLLRTSVRKVEEAIAGGDRNAAAAALEKAVTSRKLFDGKPLVSGVKPLLAHIHGDPALARVKPPLAIFSAADRAAAVAGYDAVRAKQVA